MAWQSPLFMNQLGFFRPAIFLANKLEVEKTMFFFLSQTQKKNVYKKKTRSGFSHPKTEEFAPTKVTLPKFNSSPLKSYRNPRRKDRFPTIHCSGKLAVKLLGCSKPLS